MGLKRQLHHGVTGEGKVKVVELFSASGPNGESEAEVITGFAGPYFEGGRVEIGVEFFGNFHHGFCKTIHSSAHHLDGKVARVFYQRLFARIIGKRRRRSSAHKLDGVVSILSSAQLH